MGDRAGSRTARRAQAVAVWDRLLGTAYLPSDRSFDAVVGVGGD